MNQIASSLLNVNNFDWSKSDMGTFFYVSTPFLLVMAAAAVVEQKSCFDEAQNRSANGLWVGDYSESTGFVFSLEYTCMAPVVTVNILFE